MWIREPSIASHDMPATGSPRGAADCAPATGIAPTANAVTASDVFRIFMSLKRVVVRSRGPSPLHIRTFRLRRGHARDAFTDSFAAPLPRTADAPASGP